MTDFKPFSRDSDEPEERTVAVVLSPGAHGERADETLLRSMGGTSLLQLAVQCVQRLQEADERFFHSDEPAIREQLEKLEHAGIELLDPEPPRLASSTPQPPVMQVLTSRIRSSHILWLSAYHPFLRPSTVDEAIRLFKLRPDIRSLLPCVPSIEALIDEHGRVLSDAGSRREDIGGARLFEVARAFHLLPRSRLDRRLLAECRGPMDPYLFEMSPREAFRVEHSFDAELASAYIATRGG